MRSRSWIGGVCCVCVLGTGLVARADSPGERLEVHLERGDLEGAARAMEARLETDEGDENARFGLGVARFLQAVERLAQRHYEYGVLHEHARAIPLLRLPVPPNRNPRRIAYEDARNVVKEFLANLDVAREVLEEVDTSRDVKLPLHIGRIRFDVDGDGVASEQESFWRIFQVYNAGVRREDGEAFVLALDGGDVHWLKGYTHFLSAACEVVLAHDFQEIFERTGHLFYPEVETPHVFLEDADPTRGDIGTVLDVIAFVHLLNFPVEEPQRMLSALEHLEAMIDESRVSWRLILLEQDDDHEWLPNPDQTSVFPGVGIRPEMVKGWHAFLDESEAILAGEKLIPFWRDYLSREQFWLFSRGNVTEPIPSRGRGINLRKVFTHPRRFDLVMWMQGTAATPYLEEGKLSRPETWNDILRVFRGEFFGFAVWIN